MKRMDENADFSDTFRLDIFLSKSFYKRIATEIKRGIREGVPKQIDVLKERAGAGAYHIRLRGASRSDLMTEVRIHVGGPVRNGESYVDVKYEEPRGSGTTKKSFGAATVPTQEVNDCIRFGINAFGYEA
jgi:hypothetical protein